MTDIQDLQNLIDEMELTIESKFIPFSNSRNKNNKWESLNWEVTLKKGNRVILKTDYSAGAGHCPSYLMGYTLEKYPGVEAAIKAECETGLVHKYRDKYLPDVYPTKEKIKPCIVHVMHSLILDVDVLNCTGFEDWCDSYGFSTDSIKAKEAYNKCLEIALALRNGLGEDELNELKEAFTDF